MHTNRTFKKIFLSVTSHPMVKDKNSSRNSACRLDRHSRHFLIYRNKSDILDRPRRIGRVAYLCNFMHK